MKIDAVELVAHDTGGSVALILASKYPKLVKRLILINSVCYDNWPIEPMLGLANPKLKDTMSAKDFVDKMWNEAIAPSSFVKKNALTTSSENLGWLLTQTKKENLA